MRIAKCLAFALFIAMLGAAAARAEFIDGFLPAPTLPGGATSYTMVLQGNVISDLNLTETQNSATLNPFQYVNQSIVGSGTTSVGATLNGNGNTVVTYTGSNPILSSYTFNSPNKLPNFGLDGSVGSSVSGGGPSFKVLSQSWSNGSSTTPLPDLSATVSGPTGSPVKYLTVFADVTSNGSTVGQWFEIPYVAGTTPKLTLTNYTSSNETLSNVGFMTSPTLIPLDNLNFNDYPPPGSPGSTFTPLPSFDGQSLLGGNGTGSAGGSLDQTLPEPSSLILLATGLFIPGVCFGLRRIAKRVVRKAAIA
jgi:hypothetical protein